MNLKERGITVGDLLIISILIISTVLITSKFKSKDKKSLYYVTPNETVIIKNYLST